MLLQFSVSNFRAFRDLQTLNLAASNYDKQLPENTQSPEIPGLKGKRWLNGIVLYGANASGKSTLIDAMQALSHWIGNSAKTTDPEEEIHYVEPFALDATSAREPTAFAIAFVAKGVRYEYRVAATRKLVVHESLRAWPSGKEQVWFARDWNSETMRHDFTPENPSGFPRNREIEQRTLRNMLYLSKSIAEARQEVEFVYHWLVKRFRFLDSSTYLNSMGRLTLKQIEDGNGELKSKILQVLRHADIGIMDALAVGDTTPIITDSPYGNIIPIKHPQLLHQAPNNSSVALKWERESAGTQRLFSLIGPWLDILQNGYTVCIDEIETSIHPTMAFELLKLFFSREENKEGAQIIFTTHNPLFLDSDLLRRDQVWFTEKDAEGAAHLYPLTDFQPRQGESLLRGYMAGRYGAVPFIPKGLLGVFPAANEAVSDK